MAFPNLKNKHLKDSMFTPEEFINYKKKRGDFPKFKPPLGVIICYDKNLMKHILKNHKTSKEDFWNKMYLLNETKKEIAVVGNFGIGAPSAVIVLEELIAFGVKKFISIGTAGTLQKNIKIGDLMVCEKSIRDEGASHHYIKNSKYAYASKKMTNGIIKSLRKFKQKYFIGTSWTIDTPYRETVAEAKQYQKEGVATVEMEASALFTVAKYRKVELGAIFTISDSLAELEWKPKFHLKKTKKSLENLFKISIDSLINYL
jgi:uridine phosphorylase